MFSFIVCVFHSFTAEESAKTTAYENEGIDAPPKLVALYNTTARLNPIASEEASNLIQAQLKLRRQMRVPELMSDA